MPVVEGVVMTGAVPTDDPSPACGSEKYGSSSSDDTGGTAPEGPRDEPIEDADGSRRDETERDCGAVVEGVRETPTRAICAESELVVSSGLEGMAAGGARGFEPDCPPPIEYAWLVDPIFGAKYPVVATGELDIDVLFVNTLEYVPW